MIVSKTALLRSVAVLALFVGGVGSANAAEHKASKKHHHAAAAADGGLKGEVRELREQLHALQARLDSQASAQSATAAQVVVAQEQAAAAQSQSAATSTQVAANQVKIDTLPDQVKTVVAANKPKTDKIYYKGVSVTLGGFLEAASISRDHTLGADIASGFNAIPYDNVRTGHADETRFSARQSRLSLLVQGKPSSNVDLAMYGEFDFQGAAQTANSNESNSYNPRIRHLYGTIDWTNFGDQGFGLHFLAGQNWSLVTMNTKGITPRNELTPPQIDAQYVPGFAWTRQPQARVAADFLDHTLWVAVSAENPQTTFYTTGAPAGATAGTAGTAATLPSNLAYNITGGSGFNSANTLSLNHIPDVVGKVAYEAKLADRNIHLEAFGLFRAFYDRIGSTDDNVYGGGGGAGMVAQIVPGRLDFQVSGLVGNGIGRYGSSQLPDTTFSSNGRIKPIPEIMLLAGATVHATPSLDLYFFGGEEHESRKFNTVNGLAYGYGNPLYTNAGCSTEGSSACVGNTKLIDQFTAGFWQKVYQGAWGRVQFGVQYSYTERQGYSGVGGAPSQDENMLFTSFRYYPF